LIYRTSSAGSRFEETRGFATGYVRSAASRLKKVRRCAMFCPDEAFGFPRLLRYRQRFVNYQRSQLVTDAVSLSFFLQLAQRLAGRLVGKIERSINHRGS
jgi:hypothetical protein